MTNIGHTMYLVVTCWPLIMEAKVWFQASSFSFVMEDLARFFSECFGFSYLYYSTSAPWSDFISSWYCVTLAIGTIIKLNADSSLCHWGLMRLETEQIWKIWRSNKGLCSYKVLQYCSQCLYYLFSWIINELFCYEWSVFLVFCCNKNCRENKQVQVHNPLLAIQKSKKQRKPKFLIHATGVRRCVSLLLILLTVCVYPT